MKTILLLAVLVCSLGNYLLAAPDTPTSAPVPFRLVFKSYDGDPQMQADQKKFSYQVDTLDLKQPAEFLKLGQLIPHTRLKLLKFVFKEAYNDQIKEKEDASELTIVNTVTEKTAVLKLNTLVDVSAIGPVSTPPRKEK